MCSAIWFAFLTATAQLLLTVYTYWPVSLLLTSGGLLPAGCRMERTRQTTDARHQLFHHQPAASRLKSQKSVMRTVTPLDSSASSSRLWLWKDSLTDVSASVKIGLEVAESLPAGSDELAAHRGGPCENSDEEMGLSRRRPVGGLRLRGATDDGPPPLLPPNR